MADAFGALVKYLLQVGITTFSQMFILLGPGLVLAVVMYYISNLLRIQTVSLFGFRFFLYFTAIGIAIHELGHALFAVLFGHKVEELKLFAPDPYSGTLGYVRHSYRRDNLYQLIGNFFIGIGPILFCTIVIYLASWLLIGPQVFAPLSSVQMDASAFRSAAQFEAFIRDTFAHAMQVFGLLLQPGVGGWWQRIVFLYLVLAIGPHIMLSPQDISGAWSGFVVFLGLVLLFNLFTLWIGDWATKYVEWIGLSYSFFYAIMIFTIILNVGVVVLFAVLLLVKRALA
jgi:hypothetical protein